MDIKTTYLTFNKLKLKHLICFLIPFSFANFAFSQARDSYSRPSSTKVEKGFNKFTLENIVVGGNVGAQFGNITVVNIAPTVGFKLRDSWLIGVSGTYVYYEDKRFLPSYKTNIYGGGIFTQYYFLEYFTAHLEYEVLNLEAQFSNQRVNTEALLIGGGYRSAIGSSSFFNILLLYNLLEDVNYPYDNPIIRVGFGIGL